MNQLTTKLQGLEELCSRLKGPGMRIYSLLLASPSGQVRWPDRLEEVVGQLEATLAGRHQVDAELEVI
jgi:hypothetical protein